MSVQRTSGISWGNLNTTAPFHQWGSAIQTALQAAGWQRTADTGQINWSTVSIAASNTPAGFDIWRPGAADTLFATNPYYVKLEYGYYYPSSYITPNMWITIGLGGTDGAGNLTGGAGLVSPRQQIIGQANAAPPSADMFISADAASSRMAMCMGGPALTSNLWVVIERTRDSSGNPTTDGVVFRYYSQWSNNGHYVMLYSGLTFVVPAGIQPFSSIPNITSGASGSNITVYPYYPWANQIYNAMMGMLAYFNGDTAALTPVPVNIWGAVHTYMPMGIAYSLSTNHWCIYANSSVAPMMIWE